MSSDYSATWVRVFFGATGKQWRLLAQYTPVSGKAPLLFSYVELELT